MIRQIIMFFLTALFVCFLFPFITFANGYVYVTNQGDNTVSVIDPASNTVIDKIPVESPSGIALDNEGKRAYVANQVENTVTVIDTTDNSLAATIPVGSKPHCLTFDSARNLIYVANYDGDCVSVIDTNTNTLNTVIPTGSAPWGVAVDSAGDYVYVTNDDDNSVSVIDAETQKVISTIDVGTGPLGIAVNPDDIKVYVANECNDTVSVIDTTTNTVTHTINNAGGTGIAINPSGTEVWVAHGDYILVIKNNEVIKTISVGGGIDGIAFNSSGTRAYTASEYSNMVSVINTTTKEVIATIEDGIDNPFWIAVAPADSGVSAEWIEIFLDNPGAETGDMTGWSSSNFVSVYDPSVAHKGDFYFSPINMDDPENNSMEQVINVSNYGTSLLNVEFSGYMNITDEFQHRIGYDQETDTEYEYISYNYVALFFYDINYSYLYGAAITANETDFLNWKYGAVNIKDYSWWESIRDDVYYVKVNFHYYYHAIDSDHAPNWYDIEEWRNWIGEKPIVRIDSAKLRIEFDDGPAIQETVFILTDTSPDATISANIIGKIYGTAERNHITIESGANVELLNFSGSNTITIQSDPSLFTVFRSGAYVTFEGTDNTILKIPATTTSQTIIFNGVERILVIDSGRVLLGNQAINLAPTQIED